MKSSKQFFPGSESKDCDDAGSAAARKQNSAEMASCSDCRFQRETLSKQDFFTKLKILAQALPDHCP